MVLTGRVGLVTGAGSGIGRASAVMMAAHGIKVIVGDISTSDGERVCSEIAASGGEAMFKRVDVANIDDVQELIDFAVNTYGGLDFAHNNAGVFGKLALLHEVSLEDWVRELSIDLTGVFLCMKAELSYMVRRGVGSIVNTASTAGLKAAPLSAAYTAAKHGVVGLTRSAALDYADKGIRINAIAPGMIETPLNLSMPKEEFDTYKRMMPMLRPGTPEEIASAVLFLLSDDSSFTTGAVLEIDGGFMQASRQ